MITDTERLEFLIKQKAIVMSSSDGSCFWLHWPYWDEDCHESFNQDGLYVSWRDAIDAERVKYAS